MTYDMRVAPNLLARLSDKFLVDDGCWEWTAARMRNGYGQVFVEGRLRSAHRVIYELLVGPIPVGLDIDHLCRNRGCVRPDHLEPVTRSENLRRGVGLGAVAAAKRRAWTHCQRGHEFTEATTRMRPGGRECRVCARLQQRARRARRKAQ